MAWLPHITVACIVEHNHKLLFVEEMSAGKTVLNQPAGHVEKGETLLEAAFRETLEESACEVEVQSLLGVYSHFYEHLDATYFRFCFIARLQKEHSDRELDSDILNKYWLTKEDAYQRQDNFRSPLVKRCLDDYFSGKRYPVSLIQEFDAE